MNNWAWNQVVAAAFVVLWTALYLIESIVAFLKWIDRRRYNRDVRTYNEFMSLWGRPW